MNTDLLLQIADAIEAHPKHFKMDTFIGYGYGHGSTPPTSLDELTGRCDTFACVGGWAAFLTDNADAANLETAAIEVLDITEVQAEELFYPNDETFWGRAGQAYGWTEKDWKRRGWSIITPETAADTLRRLAKGELTL